MGLAKTIDFRFYPEEAAKRNKKPLLQEEVT
jgi:hypothetical protein